LHLLLFYTFGGKNFRVLTCNNLIKILNCYNKKASKERLLRLKRNKLARLVLLTQGIGAIFCAIFLASYALALPSNQVLHGQPIFRIPLSIFGGLFLALIAISVVLSIIVKPEE